MGLSAGEAAAALKKYGYNELPQSLRRPLWRLLLAVMAEPMVTLLFVCAAVYLFLGEAADGILILCSVLAVIGITLYQEYRSTRALEALRDLSAPRALAVRDGKEIRIPARELVPGDLIVLNEGDRIAADAELVESSHLAADESLITGESVPVRKLAGETAKLYAGTLVTAGQGLARVTATGARTQMGQIGKSLQTETGARSRLQREITVLVKRFGVLAAAASLSVAAAYGFSRGDWLKGLLAGLASAMALLPEEFPVIFTVFLALGAWRLAKRNVLVRQNAAPENLGAITVLCVDKTGTLTLNQMTVRELRTSNEKIELPTTDLPEEFHILVEYAVLASHKDPFDPMEKALRRLIEKTLTGTEHIHPGWDLQREYPLSSNLLAMSCVWRDPVTQRHHVATKGAPEAVLDLCGSNGAERERWLREVQSMSQDGLRVIAVARAPLPEDGLPQSQRQFDLDFIGLVGLVDPVRPEAAAAVSECQQAGIRILMMTGDYAGTAAKVAAEVGLHNPSSVITGPELAAMDDRQLSAALKSASVFARAIPDQKLRIVRALQSSGEVVAMTGDGVNDAPSLHWADVGIAMGGRGTDVAREAADLVLLDDNFASITGAVELGRRIFANIKDSMSYVFAVHLPIAGLAIVPAVAGWPMALFPAHIVFLELIIDPACTLIFEAGHSRAGLMRQPPRPLNKPLFGLPAILASSLQGATVLGVLLSLYAFGLSHFSEAASRTIVFLAFVLSNIGLIVVNRGPSVLLEGRFFAMAAAASAALSLVIMVPVLRAVFALELPTWEQAAWALAAGTAAAGSAAVVRWLSRWVASSPRAN